MPGIVTGRGTTPSDLPSSPASAAPTGKGHRDVGPSRRRPFLMFGAVYFVQGVIQACQLNFFKPHMDAAGIDPDRMAVVASLLPFVMKWLYGLISDRGALFGRGRCVPYMMIGRAACAAAFFAACFVNPGVSFPVLAAMVLTATFFMALFDTTADAPAVDITQPGDHGRIQASMTGGRAAGLGLISLAFGFIADAAGYRATLLVIAGLVLVPLWFVSRGPEPAPRPPAHTFDRRALRRTPSTAAPSGCCCSPVTCSWPCSSSLPGSSSRASTAS